MTADLKEIPTEIPVVAAAITIEDQRILLQRRGSGGRHAGLWEFPGGKVEADETPENALIREIEEELGLVLDWRRIVSAGTAREAGEGDFPAIVMTLYKVGNWSGRLEARQGQEWGWFSFQEAERLPKPPLDVALFDRLRSAG